MPNFFMKTDGFTCLVVLSRAGDMAPGRMSERVVNKYLRYATDDMIQNNRREIRCRDENAKNWAC